VKFVSTLTRADVLGVIIGAIGVVLAIIFYIRSKQEIRPAFATTTQTLISVSEGRLPAAVEFTYNGKRIPNLYKALLFFWNRGSKTLNSADIASLDPITFHFEEKGAKVLEVRAVKATREVLKASATQNDNDITLSFDFLDRDDGVVLEVYYAGEDSYISCSGTIKGARGGIQERSQIIGEMPPFGWGSMRSTAGMMLSALLMLVFAGSLIFTDVGSKNGHLNIDYFWFIFGVAAFIFGIAGLFISSRYYLKERVPKGFKQIVMKQLSN
jgi:hypothetical protein